uniref:Uncharacterized protein n=1 Tax=Arundo donax TaxID=35708 RepID=A0A0A8XMY4_ARUDO
MAISSTSALALPMAAPSTSAAALPTTAASTVGPPYGGPLRSWSHQPQLSPSPALIHPRFGAVMIWGKVDATCLDLKCLHPLWHLGGCMLRSNDFLCLFAEFFLWSIVRQSSPFFLRNGRVHLMLLGIGWFIRLVTCYYLCMDSIRF